MITYIISDYVNEPVAITSTKAVRFKPSEGRAIQAPSGLPAKVMTGQSKQEQDQVESPADRAERYRRPGTSRVFVDRMGFLSFNRGGLGVAGHHVHEVAWDRLRNNTRLDRYNFVKVVELGSHVDEVRRYNRLKCLGDPLMPSYVEDKIDLGLMTGTHLVHSEKLGQQGGRTLFNDGKREIQWHPNDKEAINIRRFGIMCAVYEAGLLDDEEALRAIMREDNSDAAIMMEEDTMSALGGVEVAIEAVRRRYTEDSLPPADKLEKEIFKAARDATKGGRMNDADLLHLIRFRGKTEGWLSEVCRWANRTH